MYPNATDWLASLRQRASSARLEHLDVLINATGLDYPLLESLAALPQSPQQALLLAGTPEQALAAQGPVLLRLHWANAAQQAWLGTFATRMHREHRLLAMLGAWPFEPLAEHLRHCTQAQWNRGESGGLLRFYDPRLFLAVSDLLSPAQSDWFHAAVGTWHWIDRDGKAEVLPGLPRHHHEVPHPLPPLLLSNEQVAELVAWTDAEAFRTARYLQPEAYGLAKRETLMRHLVRAHLSADREQIFDDRRTAWLSNWLAQHSPAFSEDAVV